jgi:hypothetical protein
MEREAETAGFDSAKQMYEELSVTLSELMREDAYVAIDEESEYPEGHIRTHVKVFKFYMDTTEISRVPAFKDAKGRLYVSTVSMW